MKLTEVKQFREVTYRKKIKEAFPNASEHIINEAVDAAMNEIDLKKGLQKGLNVANNLANKVGKAAVNTGKKVIQKGAPIAKNLANKTKKAVVDPTLKGIKSVGKDIKKGYDNVKGLGADAVKTAKTGMAAMQKDMGGASTGAEPQMEPVKTKTDQAMRRLQNVTGGNMAVITSQALGKLAAGEVLKPNERKSMKELASALNNALQKGSNVQRIIALLKAPK